MCHHRPFPRNCLIYLWNESFLWWLLPTLSSDICPWLHWVSMLTSIDKSPFRRAPHRSVHVMDSWACQSRHREGYNPSQPQPVHSSNLSTILWRCGICKNNLHDYLICLRSHWNMVRHSLCSPGLWVQQPLRDQIRGQKPTGQVLCVLLSAVYYEETVLSGEMCKVLLFHYMLGLCAAVY